MKTLFKRIGGMLGMIVVGVLSGALLITMVYCIPVNSTNAKKSIESLEGEGWYPSATQLKSSFATYFHSYLPGVLDGSTDLIMLTRATVDIDDVNPLWEAMNMGEYSYYWHGYVVILRILLLLMDYEQIRFLNCVIQLLLVFSIIHFLENKKGKRYSLAVLSAYILLMPMAMMLSLQFSWVFYVMLLGAFLVCRQYQKMTEKIVLFFFLGIGMLTSFLDLLTYPLYTWAFPLLLLLLLTENGQKAASYIKLVIVSGVSWILGYAGMWIGKWILAGWILKRNVVQEAWEEVMLRSGSAESLNMTDRLEALYKNGKHYEYPVYTVVLLLWLMWFAYHSLKADTKAERNEKSAAYLLIAGSSFVWYFVLANHTSLHHFFTYRIWGCTVSSILILFCESIVLRKEKRSRKIFFYTLFGWGLLLILAVGMTFTAREDVVVLNGYVEYQEVELGQEGKIEEEFCPTYPRVKQFEMGIRTDSEKGRCIIGVCEQEKILYELELELAEVSDSSYVSIPVDWSFQRGQCYEIVIYVEENDSPVYMRFTKDNVNPMTELGTAHIGDKVISGQLTSGFVYSYRPLSRYTLFFLVISWLGLLAALAVEVKHKLRTYIGNYAFGER